MRQLHVIFIALIAILFFSSCSDDDDSNIVGKWEITAKSPLIECSDEAIKARIQSNYDDPYLGESFEFFENGKFRDEDGIEGDYTLKSEVITFVTDGKYDDKETEALEFSLDKNTLILKRNLTEECRSKYENDKDYEGWAISKVIVTETYTRK